MLHTYRKTALIEAEQFDGSIKQITRYKVHIVGPTSRGDTSYFLLPTKEGNMKLNAGDYIATGVDGEHWAIDQDIFERTYERGGLMLTTQARLAKRNNQPVKLVGDLYHIIDIRRVSGTSHLIATIKKNRIG